MANLEANKARWADTIKKREKLKKFLRNKSQITQRQLEAKIASLWDTGPTEAAAQSYKLPETHPEVFKNAKGKIVKIVGKEEETLGSWKKFVDNKLKGNKDTFSFLDLFREYKGEVPLRSARAVINNNPTYAARVFARKKGDEDRVVKLYNDDPEFKKFWKKEYGGDFSKAKTFRQRNAERKYLAHLENIKKTPKNYITIEEFAKKVDMPKSTLMAYKQGETLARASGGWEPPLGKYLNENFKPRKIGGKIMVKDLTPNELKKWNEFSNRPNITEDKAKQVKKLFKNDEIKDIIFKDKKLPSLKKVRSKLGGVTGNEAASTVAILSRVLKGENFREPLLDGIKKNVSAGNRLSKQLRVGKDNEYVNQFYKMALAEVDKHYRNEAGTLSSFKDNMRKTLNRVLGEGHGLDVNEVISLSAGESKGIRPFSAFVDLTIDNINRGALANYQGYMSKAAERVDTALAMGNTTEADRLIKQLKTGTLDKVKSKLKKKGLTNAQISLINFPELVRTKFDAEGNITNLTDIYDQAKIDRWKDKGLDIEGIARKKGWFPDVKKGVPFWEVDIKKMENIFEKNLGNSCIIFKTRKVAQTGGLQKGGCGEQFRRAMQDDPDGTMKLISELPSKGGPWSRLKTAASNILKKVPKGGKLGALVAGAGAVGLGTAAMMGDAEADINPETDTMVYNPVEGRFVDKENGDPEDQMGKLNWIADNPVKSSLLAMPLAYGIGAGANKLGAAKTAAYLTNWKAVIPAMMIPEKLWQYREGESLAEMTTDPWNAIWALGIDSTDSAVKKAKYYMDLAKMPIAKGMSKSEIIAAGKIAFEKTGANILGADFWKDPKRMTRLGQSITSPAAAGTDLAFQSRFKPAMGKMADVFGSQVSGKLAKRGIGSLAKRALMMTAAGAGLAATGVAGTVLAPLMLTLFGVDYLREQFGDYSMGKKKIDRLRSMGKISEEDANNYMSLLMQENLLPFGVGNRLFGKDEMMIGGQILDPDDQRTLAKGMEDEIDSIKESDKGTRAKWRQQEFFDEGGRVGMKFGGSMDRRGFLKWLAGITAGAYGAAKGLWKPGAKKVVEEVAKETLTTTKPEMWVPRLIAKIKAEGKLLEMADKKYVQGDIYEALINGKKVRLESNPVSGQHQIDWQAPDYDSEMTRTINFSEGELITEGEMIGKKTSPEVTFNEPDRSTPYRDDFTDFDWVNDSDQVLDDMQRWIGIEDVKVEPTGPKTSNFDFEEGGYDEFNQGGEVETGAIARRQSAVPPLSGPDPQAQGIAGLFSQPKQVRVG